MADIHNSNGHLPFLYAQGVHIGSTQPLYNFFSFFMIPSSSLSNSECISSFPVSGLQALHRSAHGVKPALACLLREFLLVLGSRLLHDSFPPLKYFMVCSLLHEWVTGGIHPDPANLICLLSRFFHFLVSSQWIMIHFVSFFLITGSVRNDKRCGGGSLSPCRIFRSSCPRCLSAG